MRLRKTLKRVKAAIENGARLKRIGEDHAMMLGRLLSEQVGNKHDVSSLHEVEFRVFSQWGDDGIIQWLVRTVDFPNETFIEFGVEDYQESNTRFLMMNNNWSGLVMDGSKANVARITGASYFWKHELSARAVFIDAENINDLLASSWLHPEVGILHIDIDGNDYWIWKAITVVNPVCVILEYNSVFGMERSITVPYDKSFVRTRAHYSNLYYGASLPALYGLSMSKGYAFIGCNSAGNNAYFLREDKLNDRVRKVSLEEGYVLSRFREGRDAAGKLTCHTGPERLDVIRGLPVYNVETDQIEKL